MRKIRVKNKYLILVVLFALLAMGGVHLFGGDYLFEQAQSASNAGDYAKALAYYDALIERYPKHSRIPEALYWSAELLPSFDNFVATFFPSNSSVVKRSFVSAELPEGSLSRIERYLMIQEEYPTHWAANHVHYKLADAFHSIGDPRSEELYLKTLFNARASRRLEAGMRLVQIYESQNRLEEALEIIQYCQTELAGHFSIEDEIKLGDLLAALGDEIGAREAYEAALILARNIEETFHPDTIAEGIQTQISVVGEYEERIGLKLASLEQLTGDAVSVTGTVTLLGESLAGVNIYVRLVEDGLPRFNTRIDNPGIWITDKNGNFTGQLRTGTYEFGIGLNSYQAKLVEGTHLQIVNGKQEIQSEFEALPIKFHFVEPVKLIDPTWDFTYTGEPFKIEWKPYAGAKEYEVAVSGLFYDEQGNTSFLVNPVGVTQDTTFLFEEQNLSPFGLIGVDSQGVDPQTLLGRPASFDALRIGINALDKEGNILASSTGLHFGGDSIVQGEILVQEGLRTEAEELIYARKYDQAVEFLVKQMEENSADVDALWILARIYFSGTYGQGEDPWEQRYFAHKDLAKSLKILQLINEVAPSAEVENALEIVLGIMSRD